ncbi:MAG: radical SAM protein [Nanobdellota archaeon]
MNKIINTSHHSVRVGKIAEGCKWCVKGQKLVLFITGICPRNCWYCPLSIQKKQKDVIYANEWKIKDFSDIITEAKLTNAKGAGITGGDPLSKIERTCSFISRLKNEFTEFHIHLYTSLNLIDEEKLRKLQDSGLDELRVHPELGNSYFWYNIELASKFNFDFGIEIPLIPGEKRNIKKLVDYSHKFIDFLNLNELEITETNSEKFKSKALLPKDNISQAVKGSKEMGVDILHFCREKNLNAHLCTAKTKDASQLTNRLKRRAKNVATKFDELTDDGLLLRPVVYGNLGKLINFLEKNRIDFITDGNRCIINPFQLKKNLDIIKKNGFYPAIVEEFPTWDATKTEIDYL